MVRRFLSLLVKETIQFCRDPAMLFLILYLYTGEVVMCTVALTFDVKHVSLAIVDEDQSVRSRELIERFTVVQEFRTVGRPATEAQAGEWLQSGRAVVALVIPHGFAERLARRESASIQVLLDGTNSNTAAIARGYALQIFNQYEGALAGAPRAGRAFDRAAAPRLVQPESQFCLLHGAVHDRARGDDGRRSSSRLPPSFGRKRRARSSSSW